MINAVKPINTSLEAIKPANTRIPLALCIGGITEPAEYNDIEP